MYWHCPLHSLSTKRSCFVLEVGPPCPHRQCLDSVWGAPAPFVLIWIKSLALLPSGPPGLRKDVPGHYLPLAATNRAGTATSSMALLEKLAKPTTYFLFTACRHIGEMIYVKSSSVGFVYAEVALSNQGVPRHGPALCRIPVTLAPHIGRWPQGPPYLLGSRSAACHGPSPFFLRFPST